MIVHCIGMVRSGSTLQYNILVSLVEKLGIGRGEGSFTAQQFFDPKKYAEWETDNIYHVIKMHNLHPRADKLIAEGKMKTCSVIRDIRDVAVSLKLKQGLEGKKLFSFIDDAIDGYYNIIKIPEIFIQIYEHVLPDLQTAVAQLAAFLNITVDDHIIDFVAEDCSLENTKRKVEILKNKVDIDLSCKTVLEANRILTTFEDKKTLLHPNHISRNAGASGVWRHELEPDELKTIMAYQNKWLCETGYLRISNINWGDNHQLLSFFLKGNGRFLEVGAGDGLQQSNTLHLENSGWQGILIESDIKRCAGCMANRSKPAILNHECVSHDYYNAWSNKKNGKKDVKTTGTKGNPESLFSILHEFKIESVDLLVINSVKNCLDILKGIDFALFRPAYIATSELDNYEVPCHLYGSHYKMVRQFSESAYTKNVLYCSTLN